MFLLFKYMIRINYFHLNFFLKVFLLQSKCDILFCSLKKYYFIIKMYNIVNYYFVLYPFGISYVIGIGGFKTGF